MKGILNSAVSRDRLLCPMHGRDAIERRASMLDQQHVRPLTDWVRTVRDRLDACHAATVADFDPLGGGVHARVLYLAQDPSSTATETGFISPDNNDATARATTEACEEAGLRGHERIHWNVYPWWRAAPCAEVVSGADALAQDLLRELLLQLPDIAAVVLVGGDASDAWGRLGGSELRSDLLVRSGPHPSHGWWSKPFKPGTDGRLGREVIVAALRDARVHAYGAT